MCCKDAESRVFSLALRLKVFMTIFAPDERLPTSATLIRLKRLSSPLHSTPTFCSTAHLTFPNNIGIHAAV